jgi:hypothetical protein
LPTNIRRNTAEKRKEYCSAKKTSRCNDSSTGATPLGNARKRMGDGASRTESADRKGETQKKQNFRGKGKKTENTSNGLSGRRQKKRLFQT